MLLHVAKNPQATTKIISPMCRTRKSVSPIQEQWICHAVTILCPSQLNHPGYFKPRGSSTSCPWDRIPWDFEGVCVGCNSHCFCSRSFICDCHGHRDSDHKPAACDHRGQNYHATPWDQSRSHSTTMYFIQSSIWMVPKASPGALIISCDMLLNLPLIA